MELTLSALAFGFPLFLVFIVIDTFMYINTPFEFRTTYGWWKYIPGGGVVVYLLWKLKE